MTTNTVWLAHFQSETSEHTTETDGREWIAEQLRSAAAYETREGNASTAVLLNATAGDIEGEDGDGDLGIMVDGYIASLCEGAALPAMPDNIAPKVAAINAALSGVGARGLTREQLACLLNPARSIEACAMLDDLGARVLQAVFPSIEALKMAIKPTASAYTPNMNREQFTATAVRLSKEEILERVSMGELPDTVADFGELHDYMDANTLGGFCDDQLQPVFDAIFPHIASDTENGTISSGAFMDAANDVQNAVNDWIQSGGMAADIEAAKAASME
jgi:hypothetical protein